MMWSLATATWVAPSAISCRVERSTPTVAANGPGVGLLGEAPEVLAEQLVGAVDEVDVHPNILAAQPAATVVVGARAGRLHWAATVSMAFHSWASS